MSLPPILRDLLVAIALVGAAALLNACGGGGDDAAPCAFELVTLADGRTVPAPNNCPVVS